MDDQHTEEHIHIFTEAEQAELRIAEVIGADEELNFLKKRREELLQELTSILPPGAIPTANPNPWPTLLRMIFPTDGERLAFERAVWQDLVTAMEHSLPDARKAAAQIRLMGVGPQGGIEQMPAGAHQKLGLVHDGRVTKRT